MHQKHKLIEIFDEESLKKEKIELDSYISNFRNELEQMNSLKEKIQNEIIKINDSYEKINNELSVLFEEKYENLRKTYEEECKKLKEEYEMNNEKLLREENNLKELLENKVTEIKEKLENALSNTYNIIKVNEKIDKGIKILTKKQEEKNIIVNLSYVSKINKNKKELKLISKKPMKNVEISLNQDKNNINFDEYYFNGFPCPNNIKFIYEEYLNITWSLEDSKLINIDNNKLKYRLEMRKENDNYETLYEGKESSFNIDNLVEDNNYEFKIYCLYNNIVCSSSQIMKIKPKDFISCILSELQKNYDYIQTILDWTGYKKMKLLYRGSRDGSLSKNFHEKCDNQNPTITLFKNENGHIFGGFASIPWSSINNFSEEDKDSFIFTLSNMFGTKPTKFISNRKGYIICRSNNGPGFGCKIISIFKQDCKYDILVKKDFLKEKSISEFPISYEDILNKNHSIFTSSKQYSFQLKEIEVFKLFK